MKRLLPLFTLAGVLVAGCGSPTAPTGDPAPNRGNVAAPATTPPAPAADNIQALTGGSGAGGATPIVGGENMGGGSGGGVGDAAKEAARGASTKVSGNDHGQGEDDAGTPDD